MVGMVSVHLCLCIRKTWKEKRKSEDVGIVLATSGLDVEHRMKEPFFLFLF